MKTRRILLTLVFALGSASGALAGNLVVDDNGGADFTDIQSAVDAALEDDTILVRPGTYSGFTADKGLRIVGQGQVPGGVQVVGHVVLDGFTATRRFVLANLVVRGRITVDAWTDTVLFAGVSVQPVSFAAFTNVVTSNCADVRMLKTTVQEGRGFWAVEAGGSRLEIVDGTVTGGHGYTTASFDGLDGTGGIVATVLYATRTTAIGGNGGSACCTGNYAGEGGTGLAGSFVVLREGCHAEGGYSGAKGGNVPSDGNGVCASTLRYSDSTFVGGGPKNGEAICPFTNSTVPTVDDPTLFLFGSAVPTSAAAITLEVRGEPGADVALLLGRVPQVAPMAGALGDLMVVPERMIPLGLIPASGALRYSRHLPGNAYTAGDVLVAQAAVAISPGDVRMTDSITIVVKANPEGQAPY